LGKEAEGEETSGQWFVQSKHASSSSSHFIFIWGYSMLVDNVTQAAAQQLDKVLAIHKSGAQALG